MKCIILNTLKFTFFFVVKGSGKQGKVFICQLKSLTKDYFFLIELNVIFLLETCQMVKLKLGWLNFDHP